MLGKLLKYELKASARTLLPLYAGILILSVVCSIFLTVQMEDFSMNNKLDLFFGIMYMLLFALCVAMGVLTVVSIVQRFYKNLLGDEGFLMLTLPVSSVMLLSSKLLAAIIWSLASTLTGIVAFCITTGVPLMVGDGLTIMDIFRIINLVWQEIITTPSMPTMILQMFLLGFLSIIITILTAYLAMMVGQLQTFSKHQIIVSFIAFFLIGWAFSTVFALLPMGDNDIYHHFFFASGWSAISHAMWIPIVEFIIQSVLLFIGTNWMLKNKLNL